MSNIFSKRKETQYMPFFDINNSEDGQFVQPPCGARAEKESFNVQSVKFNTKFHLSEVEESKVLHVLEELYSPARWEIPEDFLERSHFDRVVDEMLTGPKNVSKKSPGAIFAREGLKSNQEVFDHYGREGIWLQVSERLEKLEKRSPEENRYESDPTRVFVKAQAHKKKKAIEKRWRLIFGTSLIDQIIDRLLYGEMVKKELSNFQKIPSKPGMSFEKGAVNRFYQQYNNGGRRWTSWDKKQHDFCVSGRIQNVVRNLNERQLNTQGPRRERWIKISRSRNEAMNYGYIVFSDGTVIRKIKPGLQPSGAFLTINSNCKHVAIERVMYNLYKEWKTGQQDFLSMGDDTLQDGIMEIQEFIDFQESHGSTYTFESEDKEPGPLLRQNFCSRKMVQLPTGVVVPVPLNWDMNTYELCHREDPTTVIQALESLCMAYAFHPRFQDLHQLLTRCAPENVRSANYYRDLLTGHETTS